METISVPLEQIRFRLAEAEELAGNRSGQLAHQAQIASSSFRSGNGVSVDALLASAVAAVEAIGRANSLKELLTSLEPTSETSRLP